MSDEPYTCALCSHLATVHGRYGCEYGWAGDTHGCLCEQTLDRFRPGATS